MNKTINSPVWKRSEPDSPCKNICVIHRQAKICIGCYRNAGEIRKWAKMDSAERLKILAALPARAATLAKRRGGRRHKTR